MFKNENFLKIQFKIQYVDIVVINDEHRLAVSISLAKMWLNSVFLRFPDVV